MFKPIIKRVIEHKNKEMQNISICPDISYNLNKDQIYPFQIRLPKTCYICLHTNFTFVTNTNHIHLRYFCLKYVGVNTKEKIKSVKNDFYKNNI